MRGAPPAEAPGAGATPAEATVRALTVAAAPALVPELTLRLATPECALWRLGPDQARALGAPDPYWAFAWAGGQALARWVLDHPEAVRGARVLDFGAGSGLVGLAAARAGAGAVLCADVDPLAVAAVRVNAAACALPVGATGEDLVGRDGGWDVVLAGDMLYEAQAAARFLPWLTALQQRGARVLLGDPRRGHRARADLRVLATVPAPSDVDPDGTLRVDCDVLELRGGAP